MSRLKTVLANGNTPAAGPHLVSSSRDSAGVLAGTLPRTMIDAPFVGLGGNSQNHQRQRLYRHLLERSPKDVSAHEISTHFRTMPRRYWERVTKADLAWGLESVHAFFGKAPAADSPTSAVIADSRHCPERGFTKVMVCAWDTPGLLAKIAAGFSALRVNILRADAFTRNDGIALDVFHVSDLEHGTLENSVRLAQLVFLLEGALMKPPRFASMWAAQCHKSLPLPPGQISVVADNEAAPDATVIRVEAPDRVGLLHDILQALTDANLNIIEAVVETDHAKASDLLYVTDFCGRKVPDKALADLCENLKGSVMPPQD